MGHLAFSLHRGNESVTISVVDATMTLRVMIKHGESSHHHNLAPLGRLSKLTRSYPLAKAVSKNGKECHCTKSGLSHVKRHEELRQIWNWLFFEGEPRRN